MTEREQQLARQLIAATSEARAALGQVEHLAVQLVAAGDAKPIASSPRRRDRPPWNSQASPKWDDGHRRLWAEAMVGMLEERLRELGEP